MTRGRSSRTSSCSTAIPGCKSIRPGCCGQARERREPALMTVFRNDGRWDGSNVVLEGTRIARYAKGLAPPPPQMRWIDYGLLAFRREVIGERVGQATGGPRPGVQRTRRRRPAGGARGQPAVLRDRLRGWAGRARSCADGRAQAMTLAGSRDQPMGGEEFAGRGRGAAFDASRGRTWCPGRHLLRDAGPRRPPAGRGRIRGDIRSLRPDQQLRDRAVPAVRAGDRAPAWSRARIGDLRPRSGPARGRGQPGDRDRDLPDRSSRPARCRCGCWAAAGTCWARYA